MPEPNEQTSDALGRHWDALVQGEYPPSSQIDPSLADAITWVIAHDDAPEPGSAFINRLEQQLLAVTRTPRIGSGLPPAALPVSLNGRASLGPDRPSPLPGGPSRSRWKLTQLATAALLLVSLAAGLTALQIRDPRSQETIIPAPGGDIVTETLLNEPGASLPRGLTAIGVLRCQVQPGGTIGEPHLVGSLLVAVRVGTVDVALSEGKRTITGGETLRGSTSAGYRLRNVGKTAADITAVQILDAAKTTSATDGGFGLDSPDPRRPNTSMSDPPDAGCITPITVETSLPLGPGWARLERLTMPLRATAPTLLATGADWVGVEAGRVGVTLEGGQLPLGWRAGEEREYGAGQPLPHFAAGTQVTLHNAGDEPLVLLRLTAP